MNPETRRQLWRGWGLCERHAWGFLSVEAAFRHGWMPGPAVLYEDLMSRALRAVRFGHLLRGWPLPVTLREKGPCLMCEAGFGPDSPGFAAPALVARGRDPSQLRSLARTTRPFWEPAVCGRCAGTGAVPRCRRHLVADIWHGVAGDLALHRSLVSDIRSRLVRYARSFRFEYRGTATGEDMGALIAAVGWCSGWRPILGIDGE